ncbi:MAG: enolase C-terminal domain-like protein [Candidatus Sericytochromatia bacterium]|nr:enolase C-terminal domain-like protein [Candidatus Sericytochromatia bacterium]
MKPDEITIAIRAQPLQIPFRTRFKHASAERKVSDSVWVTATRGGLVGLGEGAPRAYVTGESPAEALVWIDGTARAWVATLPDLAALRALVVAQREVIDRHPAAWCAVELALLDLFAQERGQTVEGLLGLAELTGPFRYTAVLGDETGLKFSLLTLLYLARGMRDFKLKLTTDQAQNLRTGKLFARLTRPFSGIRVRVDANNAWGADTDGAIAALNEFRRDLPLFAVEEPLTAFAAQQQAALGRALELPVILDESLCRLADFIPHEGDEARWMANLRVSKLGGLLRALDCLAEAQRRGWGIVVGAQVGETSVLTRAALTLAQAAGPSLVAQEGAYGTLLLAREVVAPVLQFGQAGRLGLGDVAGRPGWGLREVAP